MIHFITGNLFDSKAQALVNTVNTQGVMGKGIALQFREAYPENYRLYRDACSKGQVVTGRMFVTQARELDGTVRTIINFPTKRLWRNPSEFSFIADGLADLCRIIEDQHITSVAIPPLGTNNGGLDWNVVKPMMVQALTPLNCDVTIYEPSAHIAERMKQEKCRLTPARAMLLSTLAFLAAVGGTPSEFAAEKAAYFLQKFGAQSQFNLHFTAGFYGPYSGKVRHVLHYLNGSYLIGFADLSNRPFDPFWLTPDAAQASRSYLQQPGNEQYQKIVRSTTNFLLGYSSNFLLELLSTVSYLQDDDPAFAKAESIQQQVDTVKRGLHLWSVRKERQFNDDALITDAIHHLAQIYS